MPQMKVCGIKNAAIAQMVEHVIGNDEVSSSNLLSSSKNPDHESGRDFFVLLKYNHTLCVWNKRSDGDDVEIKDLLW